MYFKCYSSHNSCIFCVYSCRHNKSLFPKHQLLNRNKNQNKVLLGNSQRTLQARIYNSLQIYYVKEYLASLLVLYKN